MATLKWILSWGKGYRTYTLAAVLAAQVFLQNTDLVLPDGVNQILSALALIFAAKHDPQKPSV